MLPLPMETEPTQHDNSIQKCYYYNRGYCKKKQNCTFWHPLIECTENCIGKNKCTKRYMKKCKYGRRCHHNKQNLCEYKHDPHHETSDNSELIKLKHEIENMYREKMKNLEEEIISLREKLIKETNFTTNQGKAIEMIRKTAHETSMTNIDQIKNIKVQHKIEIDKIKNKYIDEVEIFKANRRQM